MEDTTTTALDRLRYRRQFLLCRTPPGRFPSWKKTQIRGGFFVEAHPDLGLAQAADNRLELTLLGYMVDPDRPEKDDARILKRLLPESRNPLDVIPRTSGIAGRWILIASNGDAAVLLGDPCGLRSVYYTQPAPFCCASQPSLMPNPAYSHEAEQHFNNSSYRRKDREYWWPSGVSLYRGISHLTPNHYLDLRTGETRRFWPRQPLIPLDLDEAAERAAALLKRMVVGAAARFRLALPITAGVDSRTLLAAARDIASDLYCYTLVYDRLTPKSHDVAVPARLLPSLGLRHEVMDCKERMPDDFRRIYMANVADAHEAWGDIAYGLHRAYPQDRVCLKGNVSETARCFYYKDAYPRTIDGPELARLAGMPGNEFAARHFRQWLDLAAPVARACGLDILDLFYWEHRMGNWQAMSQLEWDIAQEAFTPFNCRDLLALLLSAPAEHRRPPYELHRRIIQRLWPDVLKERVNPIPFLRAARHWIKMRLLRLFRR